VLRLSFGFRAVRAKIHNCCYRYSYVMLKKVGMLSIGLLLCFTTLTGCASRLSVADSRLLSLEFELNRTTSRIDRLESKIELQNLSLFPSVASRKGFEIDPRREQLEKLLVDLTEQVSRLKEQLNDFAIQSPPKD